jgi:hypothetical protein
MDFINKLMVREFFIEETARTPRIDLNKITGNLILSGKSIPENAARVYEPVLSWITGYVLEPCPTTNLMINLEYYNTSSAVWLTKIIKALARIKNPEYALIIHLYMSVEDYNEIEDFNDIKDTFLPLSDVEHNVIPSISIKIHETGDKGDIIKDTMVFFEEPQYS